jgi:hypothetical protein
MKFDRVSSLNKVLFWLWILLLMAIIPEFWPAEVKSAIAAGAFVGGTVLWAYRTHIDRKNEDLKRKDDRIQELEKRIQELERNLGVREPKTEYSLMSDKDLRKATLVLASQLRQYSWEWGKADTEVVLFINGIKGALTEEKLAELRARDGLDISLDPQTRQAEYNKYFKAKTILLRNELEKRVPQTVKPLAVSQYENQFRPQDVEAITTDLEKLANSLPS